MVNIKARTRTLLSKVSVGWSKSLGKNLVPVTGRHLKNTKEGKDARTVGNNSHKLYTAELCIQLSLHLLKCVHN